MASPKLLIRGKSCGGPLRTGGSAHATGSILNRLFTKCYILSILTNWFPPTHYPSRGDGEFFPDIRAANRRVAAKSGPPKKRLIRRSAPSAMGPPCSAFRSLRSSRCGILRPDCAIIAMTPATRLRSRRDAAMKHNYLFRNHLETWPATGAAVACMIGLNLAAIFVPMRLGRRRLASLEL